MKIFVLFVYSTIRLADGDLMGEELYVEDRGHTWEQCMMRSNQEKAFYFFLHNQEVYTFCRGKHD